MPMSYIIVEVLFGFLLQLPSPPQVPICYASIFIELCKLEPGSYPRIVSFSTSIYCVVATGLRFLDFSVQA